MRVIVTGASGMVGMGVLLECIDSESVESILVVGRTPCGVENSKLKELLHGDFMDFSGVEDQLQGYDACFWCLGVSAAGMDEAKYSRITYDYTLNFGRLLSQINPEMTFIYVSGAGTDSTEKGRQMWARVKGKTENDLLKLPFKDAYMFRPGMIQPKRGIKSKTPLYNFVYTGFGWLINLIKLMAPNSSTDTTTHGKAMINAVLHGYEQKILENPQINALGGK
ncbi:MAG: epimerase [Bacteroidia bacterium]|nr:epimerase [Bacteroidia bacterium]